ncbi:glycosyltransferase family 4 protein [Salipiger sp. 1_MG-2023]|uniref:glycosyltransferase family 4 protein n=1 Tax=Salipiger sp. 1_MG-2023 TaxID=3062665 RepID=UPI0026E11FCB|nr:glycosyltransferase family 4 protein [Salipiger sp. 1_MG-2023]MDO6588242.1 glycosyltransferase family 4 protein [Salipiger sp. 1_MG-2023]
MKQAQAPPPEETIQGVQVFRAPVWFKIGRGPVSPGFIPLVQRIARRSKALHLHLPMLEAGVIAALAARIAPELPIVSTYHIDLWLAPSLTSSLQIAAVNRAARSAIRRGDHVVVNSDDQARHSLLWDEISRSTWSAIPAPCLDPRGGQPTMRDGPGHHVGFLGRIVPDKGIEYLIRAFLRSAAPEDRLLLGGEYDTVAGGSNIAALRGIAAGDPRVRFLGALERDQTRDFYASIDTCALTSVAESFGIVQAEAMMCGLPVVGSDLPGGRVPLVDTGFGILTQPRDVDAIAAALTRLKDFPEPEKRRLSTLAQGLYGADSCVNRYATLFSGLIETRSSRAPCSLPQSAPTVH